MMRHFTSAALLSLAGPAVAYPAIGLLAGRSFGAVGDPEAIIRAHQVSANETNCGPIPCLTFNAQEQYVNVEPGSPNQYVAPGASDIRGPCPGLNAAANHGFLPHNGVPNIAQTIEGLGSAYGMGVDIAGFLAAFAVVMDGDVDTLTWSIGGPYRGGLLSSLGGQPQGISYSHNKYEGDASACRGDAYINNGDAHSLILSKFEHLYNLDTSYTLDTLRSQNLYNRQVSESTNPYYFSAPFSGLLVAPAAHNFIINFMSNHSADNPSGYLDQAQLRTFFGVSVSPSGQFTWNKGQEQIPQNWYRRPSDNPYGIANAVGDVIIGASLYPQTVQLGGNTGTVNSFAGVDVGDLTGGVYNSANLLDGNNLGCLAIQAMQAGLPDTLKTLLGDITPALDLINSYTSPILGDLGCPTLSVYNQGLFNKFPGYSYNPTGPDNNY